MTPTLCVCNFTQNQVVESTKNQFWPGFILARVERVKNEDGRKFMRKK